MPIIKVTTDPDPEGEDPMRETMDVEYEDMEPTEEPPTPSPIPSPSLTNSPKKPPRQNSSPLQSPKKTISRQIPSSPLPLLQSPKTSRQIPSTLNTPRPSTERDPREPPNPRPVPNSVAPTPRNVSRLSLIDTPPGSPPHSPAIVQTSRLAQVDRTINFEEETPLKKVGGRIYTRNVTEPSRPLIYKIKTTAPQKFHVWPTIGLISEGGVSSPKVTVKPRVVVSSIKDDSFLVQVMIVPMEVLNQVQVIEDEDQRGNNDHKGGREQRSSLLGEPGHSTSTLDSLNGMWRQIAVTGAQLEEHRVEVTVSDNISGDRPPSPPPPPLSPGQPIDEWSSRIDGLEAKLNEIDEFISEQLSFVQLLLYTLMGMVCSFSVILFFWGGGGVGGGLSSITNLQNPDTSSTGAFSFSTLLSMFTSSDSKLIPSIQEKLFPVPPSQQQQPTPSMQTPMYNLYDPAPDPSSYIPPKRPPFCPMFG